MSVEIGQFSILRNWAKSNPRSQKSGDLDKNSKRNQSLKFREKFVWKND